MGPLLTSRNTHPAGELEITPGFPPAAWPLDTPGGRYFAEWDPEAPVTREIRDSIAPVLGLPWIMDIDTRTIQ